MAWQQQEPPLQLMSKRDRGCEIYSLKEIKRKRGESYQKFQQRVLNNFYMRFSKGGGSYRWFIDVHTKDWDSRPSEKPGAVQGKMSNLRWNQTNREFYETLDLVIGECGCTLIEVRKAIDIFNDWIRVQPEPRHKQLWEILRPIYVALRKKGYSISDLRS